LVIAAAAVVLGALAWEKVKKTEGEGTAVYYDTDPGNDAYIKGELTGEHLLILDRVLLEEKRKGGLRLSGADLKELAGSHPEVLEAYVRWRYCRDMMRSHHRTVYPDER
jgi:hypothetical protein